MKIVIISALVIKSLLALTLNEYVHLSLEDSSDSRVLVENEMNLQLDYNLQKNNYNSNYSPISSINADKNSNSIRLGMQGEKRNIYGGAVYASIDGARNDYKVVNEAQYGTSLNVGYRQSLFRKFGQAYNTVGLTRSKERLNLIDVLDREQKAAIIIKATEYYYDAVLNSAKIKIQESAVKRVSGDYKGAEAKQKSGLVSKIDVYRAKISYLDQNRNLNDSVKRYKDSLDNLFYYLNKEVDTSTTIDKTDAIKMMKFNFEDKSNEEILLGNLSWNEMLIDEKNLKRELFNADRNFLPDLELNVNYKRSSENRDIADVLNLDSEDWAVGLNSNYNFNTSEQTIAKQKLTIQKTKLLRDKASLKRLIFKDINTLKNDYINILENLEIYKLKKIQAQEALKVSKIRYERGLSSNLDILDAESAYSSSQIDYVNEILRHNLALLKYAKAMNILNIEFINKVAN
ncbi:MAG: TolC family protein [Campylobacterota bacterium]|nr:TolC family protein [Campylobacterota bacterium]